MDLIDDPTPGQNAPEFTVSELSGAVKRAVEQGFSHVRVRAELGRVMIPRSGHVYLDLKDDRAVLAGIIWKGQASKLKVRPEEGMEVVVTGRLTTYPGQSKYQIIIESLAPAGVGALMAMLEKRKAALAADGLFAAERKRPLPVLPAVIGVVTSPSGAVIRDILHRLRDRFPREVLVWPVAVQGDRCADEVTAAIKGFNALLPGAAVPRPDVLIVARGGGSVEDLWGFNEENVVRAAAASDIPLISAVGHETDTTLIDFASDHRAPTPTAAAEVAVPVRAELLGRLQELETRMLAAQSRRLREASISLERCARALPRPGALVDERIQRLDLSAQRLPRALLASVQLRRLRFVEHVSARFSPMALNAAVLRKADRLKAISAPIRLARLVQQINALNARVEHQADRYLRLKDRILATPLQRLKDQSRLLTSLSYHRTLERGYAIIRDGAGSILTDVAQVSAADAVEAELKDGRVTLHKAAGKVASGAGSGKRSANTPPKPDQGSLF